MWLIRKDEETDERFGKRPEERSMEELINSAVVPVDKHSGPTSHTVTLWVREIFNVKKAGHAGTLDPKVTGVLPVALANATKAMCVLMTSDKEYVGIMHLHKPVEEDVLRKTIAEKFVGKIVQVPPVRSAVARKPRVREVYFFDILETEGKDVLFKVGCQAGVYVRKLVSDLGEELGVGAHLAELRRTRAGCFEEGRAYSLVEIRDAYEFWKEDGDESMLRKILVPIEYAIPHVKKVFVSDAAINSVCHGAPVFVKGITRIQEGIVRGETVAIFSLKEELIALGIAKMTSEEMFKRKRGVAVRTDRVLMERDTYPKLKA